MKKTTPIYSLFLGITHHCGIDGSYDSVDIGMSKSCVRLLARMEKFISGYKVNHGITLEPNLTIYNVKGIK